MDLEDGTLVYSDIFGLGRVDRAMEMRFTTTLVKVEPLPPPRGDIFYVRFRYGTTDDKTDAQ